VTENVLESLFAEIDCGGLTLEIVVSVPEQSEVCAVLLKVVTVRIDDGDRFFRMREDLSIQIGVQFDWTRGWLGWSFTHGNLHGNWAG
jgi:hypothetical protein